MFKKLICENFKGVKEIEVELDPQLVIVEGDNAEGKSSILDSFRCIADGGGGLELIRNGETKAKLDFVLDDGVILRKTITPKRPSLDAERADGTPIPSPKEYVNSLMEGVGYDPLRFLACDKKERLAYLLAVMPIRFEPEELVAIGVDKPAGVEDLSGLASIEEQIRTARKRVNADEKSAEGTIARLAKDMPPDDGTDWTARWKDLEVEATDIEAQIREATEKAHGIFGDARQALTEERDKHIAELQKQIAELEQHIRNAGKNTEVKIFEARDIRDKAIQRIADVAKPERERLATEKAQAWERSQNQGRIAGQRETVAAMKADVKKLSVESARMTRVLAAIAELRNAKLSTLPVEGVRITAEGDIFYDDVAFGQLNTATQYALSFRFARLKGVRFMLADHGEALGDEAWIEFCTAMRSQNEAQVVVAVRTRGPLSVHRGPTLDELAKGITGLREKARVADSALKVVTS